MDDSRLDIDAAREALKRRDPGGGPGGDDRDELVERVREMADRPDEPPAGEEPDSG